MAVIKVKDLAFGRLRSPDLDQAEEFLTHFGMIRAARTPSALYMRGTDAGHHLHVTELGAPAFVGLAYYAASEEDLQRVAKAPGASAVEAIDEPGGGRRVRLREPNGYQVEVVHEALLSGWHCRVLAARDGDEALRLVATATPDLLLLDFHLDGGQTGLMLRERLAAALPPRPCVIITADHSVQVRDAVAAAGCPLLHKPLKPLALKSVMARLLAAPP